MYDIIFVCGIYKSGTSYISDQLVKLGYNNPALANNPNEFGHGLSQRYYTHECLMTREINARIFLRQNVSRFKKIISPSDFQNQNDEIIGYLSTLNYPTVLKDGQFAYTLQLWLNACNLLGKTYKVYFSKRNIQDLSSAWKKSYFTKTLRKEYSESMFTILEMCNIQECLCNILHVPLSKLVYEKPKPFKTL